jgi:hypothetical protein
MPLDGNNITRDPRLWRKFENYLYEAYRENPRHLADMERWFADHHARRDHLRLSYVAVRRELTGEEFFGFCLNEQMFFSQHESVLLLPRMREPHSSPDKIFPDRFVGVHLHDYGRDEMFFHVCNEKIEKLDWEDYFVLRGQDWSRTEDYAAFIAQSMDNRLQDEEFLGNDIDVADWRMRYTAKLFGGMWHRDKNSSKTDVSKRVFIHVMIGAGTGFALEGNIDTPSNSVPDPKCIVACPVGATSSHIAVSRMTDQYDIVLGIKHWASAHKRALLIKPDDANGRNWQPVRANNKAIGVSQLLALAA